MDARQDFGRLERAAASRFLASGMHPSAGLLMTPTGFHHAQSAGTSGLLRTGLPELGRSGPPHATPAGSVSTPSPLPQCPNYLSSLSINTGGSNYGYLHGDAMGGSMPPPSPSPFRTPPGLPAVRHHWSHTPPPPLDSYGRYGLGTSLFSLYPMISSSEASTYCLQASAARLMAAQKVSPYHHIFGSRDFGLYHPGLTMGSPYSPTLSMDPTELGSPSSAIDMERAGTPLDFMCKSANIVHSCPPQQFPPPSTKHLHPSSSYQDLRCSTSSDIGMLETTKAATKKRPSKETWEVTNSHSKPSLVSTTGLFTSATRNSNGNSVNNNNIFSNSSTKTSCTPCKTSLQNVTTTATPTSHKHKSRPSLEDQIRKLQNHNNLKPEVIKTEFQRKNESCRKTRQPQPKCNRENQEKLIMNDNYVQVQALNLTRDAKPTSPSSSSSSPPSSASTSSPSPSSSSSPFPKANGKPIEDNGLTKLASLRRENDERCQPRFFYHFPQTYNSCETMKHMQVPTGSVTETPFCDKNVRVKQEKYDCTEACHFRTLPVATEAEEEPTVPASSPFHQANVTSFSTVMPNNDGKDRQKKDHIAPFGEMQNKFQLGSVQSCALNGLDWPTQPSRNTVSVSKKCEKNEVKISMDPEGGSSFCVLSSTDLRVKLHVSDHAPNATRDAVPSCTSEQTSTANRVEQGERGKRDVASLMTPTITHLPCNSVISSSATTFSQEPIVHVQSHESNALNVKLPAEDTRPVTTLLHSQQSESSERDDSQLEVEPLVSNEPSGSSVGEEKDPADSGCKREDSVVEDKEEQSKEESIKSLPVKSSSEQDGHHSAPSTSIDLSSPSKSHAKVSVLCLSRKNSIHEWQATTEPQKALREKCRDSLSQNRSMESDVSKSVMATTLSDTSVSHEKVSAHLSVDPINSHKLRQDTPHSLMQKQHENQPSNENHVAFHNGPKHSSLFQRQNEHTPTMPFDFTTKTTQTKHFVPSTTSTTTLTTTKPVTQTSTSMSSASQASYPACFSDEVQHTMNDPLMPLALASPPSSSTNLGMSPSSLPTTVEATMLSPGHRISPTLQTNTSVSVPTNSTSINAPGTLINKLTSVLRAKQQAALATSEIVPSSTESSKRVNSSNHLAVVTASSVALKKNLNSKESPSKAAYLPSKAVLRLDGAAPKPSEGGGDPLVFSHTITTGASIPVGIAVARQRQDSHSRKSPYKQRNTMSATREGSKPSKSNLEQHINRAEPREFIREQKELLCHEKSANGPPVLPSSFSSNLIVAGSATTTTTAPCWDDTAKPGASLQTRWMPSSSHGHGVGQTLWLGQGSFSAAPAPVPMQISSMDPSHLQFPPLGYQLARDPITNHLFLIPAANIDVMERPPLWPAFATSATATPPQLQPHHNPFQQFIFQQQQQQILQQDSQSTTIEFRLQQELPPVQDPAKNSDIPLSNANTSCSEPDVNGPRKEALISSSIKGEDLRNEDFKEKTTISLATHSPIIASIPVPGQAFPYVIPAPNAMPYFFDPQTATAVVHVTPATSVEPLHLDASDKRSQGTSPVPCSDMCLTPPSDGGGIPVLVDSEIEGESGKMINAHLLEDGTSIIKAEPVMADACNQTETPPMTDEEDDDEDEGDTSDLEDDATAGGALQDRSRRVVKVEDISVQCELLDELLDIPLDSSERKPYELIDVHGLELLSNIIEERQETYRNPVSTGDASTAAFSNSSGHSTKTEQNIAASLSKAAALSSKEHSMEDSSESTKLTKLEESDARCSKIENGTDSGALAAGARKSLGGLGLLCALAEQRILQETLESDPQELSVADIKVEEAYTPCPESPKDQVDQDSEGSKDPNRNPKNAKSQKEFKDFIAHKSIQYASAVNKNSQNDAADMDSAELEMRLRLADLQKKYKEKQKELAKLLPKKEKDMLDKSCTKRGPGRPRKRKCLPLYNSRITKFHFDKLKLSSKKEHALMAWQSLVHGTTTKKMSCSSSSKTSKALVGTGKARDGRPILKPAVLNPQKMSSSTDWLTDANLGASAEQKCPMQIPPTKTITKPLTFGGFNFLSVSSSNTGTPVLSFKMSLKPMPPPISVPLSPQAGQQVEVKDTMTTPEDSTTDNYDSDDSNGCTSGKSISQKSATVKEVANKSSKRKECSKSSKNESKKVFRVDEEDSTDLSKSFSSLSVSCTMPPFQGCEAPSGLGLLAKYASQVVEQSIEESAPKSINTSSIAGSGSKGLSTTDQEAKHKLKGANGDRPSEQDLTSSSNRRKPGRPKKHSPLKVETATETVVAKKSKVINFLKSEPNITLSRLKMSHPKLSKTGEFSATSKTSNSPNSKCSFLTDEAWLRRRSERIFLSEASTTPSFTMTDTIATSKKSAFSSLVSHPLPSSIEENEKAGTPDSSPLKYKVYDCQKTPKVDKIRSKKRPSKEKPDAECPIKKQKLKQLKGNKDRSSSEEDYEEPNVCQNSSEESSSTSGLSPSESEPESPGNSSFSEGDNLPLSKLIEQTVFPEPRSCIIKAEELQDSLRVLTMMDGLFYAGFINAIRAPDVYGITIDGERGNRPHIYSREEILQEAIIEVKPESMQYLPEGTRVCAYWSQQYRCLYPGTVSKSSSPNPSIDKNCINVEFDDGDSGRIPLENIRLLPPGLPIISYEPDPVILGKRRTKSTGDLSREKRTIVPLNEGPKLSQNSQTTPGKTTRIKSPTKLHKGKTNALADNDSGVSENPDRVHATKPASSTSPVASTPHNVGALKAKNSNPTLKQLRVEARKCDFKPKQASSSPAKFTTTATLTTSSMSMSQSTTSIATLMSTASATSSSIAAFDDSSRGATKGEANAAASSWGTESAKPKKRKKHRERGDSLEKKHRHHHHHHHTHKHKRKHEKHEKQDNKATSENVHVVSTSSHSMPKSGSLATESKKSELTLTIKTNNTDLNQAEAEEAKKGNNIKVNEKELDEGVSTSQSEDREDTSDSNTDTLSQKSDDNPPATKKKQNVKDDAVAKASPKTKKERSNSVETKSKIAAFLPARQLWNWAGKSFRRPGTKGKAKKEFYKSITRGKERIDVGDSAVFLSTGRPHLPYIGRIIMMWESWGGNMVVKVKWFYHPEETKGGKKLLDNKGALYQSFHVDENDVQTISHKCEVLSWVDYKDYKEKERTPQSKYGAHYDNNDVYYLAGTYEPGTGVVTMEPGVS